MNLNPFTLRGLILLLLIPFFISCSEESNEDAEKEEIVYNVPEGFELEELFVPSDHDMGTWVSLAEGENGIMYACDQFGGLYQFQIPAVGEKLTAGDIDSVAMDIGYAHGLLWAFDHLYVAVNRRWADTIETASGVYRLADSDNDGQLDHKEMLLKLEGDGEHGPHSMVVGPSGNDIYFIAGNHTLVPEELAENSLVPNYWGEDNLLTPYLDARGHATEVEAPGGWIARTDPAGENWQLFSAGYRNAFDIGFNAEGELFAFDADMEWDFGMPWYRPIRICHATSGSEFGWRTGTGKWPVYYPDALPAVVDLGQGSPTAVLMGDQLDFPAKYKHGMFVADWSFGTMYFIDLIPEGSSYTGTKAEFLSGVPLPLTDVIAGSDGHMYFATGGRRLESHLYRLRPVGDHTSEEINRDTDESRELRALRHDIEELHEGPVSGGVDKAWTYLDHDDRFIRYAARVGLEYQSQSAVKQRFASEEQPAKLIAAAIALARTVDPGYQNQVLDKLSSINWSQIPLEQQIDLARAYELTLIRLGMPSPAQRNRLISNAQSVFPSESHPLNRELSELLVYLQDPQATAQLTDLMIEHTEAGTTQDVAMLSDEVSSRHEDYGSKVKDVIANMPPAEAIFYAVLLSHVDAGWNEELRETYFQWFFDVFSAEGGMSFKAFMENIRQAAVAKIPEADRARYEELSGVYSPVEDMADLPQPEGPGQDYNMYDINRALRGLRDYEGSVEAGKKMFEAALCSSCHRMNGEGGSSGPDLSQINTRFDRGDIVDAIFSPSEVISDQYAFTLFTLNDDSKVAGRIFSEDDEKVVVMPNPYSPTVKVEVAKSDIADRGLSPVSPMPPGLLNRLNPQEVADLFAYLLSGGDEEYFYYGGEKGLEEAD